MFQKRKMITLICLILVIQIQGGKYLVKKKFLIETGHSQHPNKSLALDYQDYVNNQEQDSAAGNDYSQSNACKPGWKFFAHTGNCYKYFVGRFTWQSARDHCKGWGLFKKGKTFQ